MRVSSNPSMLRFCGRLSWLVAPRAAQACDTEEWGAAAETEAQWRHSFETSEIPGIVPASNSQEYRASP